MILGGGDVPPQVSSITHIFIKCCWTILEFLSLARLGVGRPANSASILLQFGCMFFIALHDHTSEGLAQQRAQNTEEPGTTQASATVGIFQSPTPTNFQNVCVCSRRIHSMLNSHLLSGPNYQFPSNQQTRCFLWWQLNSLLQPSSLNICLVCFENPLL